MAKYLCILVRAYWFSVTSFSKWLPGGHIRFFSFWMAWFRQRNSSLLWNFSFKFHVHVLCGCRQKPNDCQLWKWLPCDFEQCHPLLWGGGILVDHWSTISSYEMEYSFYSFYWLDSLEIWLDHYSTYYRSLLKNLAKLRCQASYMYFTLWSPKLQYKLHPEFWPHRLIFKTSL